MTDKAIDSKSMDILFREARTYSAWQNKDVTEADLVKIYDLLKMAPTSANCSPARIVFVKSTEAKARLKPHMDAGNVDKTMSAPVTALIANDKKFYDQMKYLFPHTDARAWFVGNQPLIDGTAFRNGSLQGAYLILAARALGLDCGPMSGFNKDGVKKEFFADQDVEVNFMCNIGYGDPASLHPRSPRFNFKDVCKVV